MTSDPEHACDSGDFDRSVCPPPCGTMHSFCTTCGQRQDRCAHETPAPTADRDQAETRYRDAYFALARVVEETLAPALGYLPYPPGSPGYSPDQVNYATGDHTAETLVTEAARRLSAAGAGRQG